MPAIRIAGVQMDVAIGNLEQNIQTILDRLETAHAHGAQLVVFPECATSGYCFDSLEEALPFALTRSSPELERIKNACANLKCYTVFGFLERDENRIHNAAACVGPNGIVGIYRKIHLPFLGIDRFTTPGSSVDVLDLTDLGLRIGMLICYDCSFPEAARVLMLDGADLIVLPTNWPPTSGLTASVIPNARALENNVYMITVNRVGTERGFSFIGKSKVCNPAGADLVFMDHNREEVFYAEIDPTWARRKHLVNIPGKHEVHRVNDRRPEAYTRLMER